MKSYECNSKFIMPLAMIYLCLMISSELLVNKPVSMLFGYTTAATFITPLCFILNDVVAEVYGFKQCWRLLCWGFIVTLFFNVIFYCGLRLPSPSSWDDHALLNFSESLFRIELSSFVAYMVSGFINIRLLTKWKFLMRGKYFWVRSIGSSGIGEAVYSILNVLVLFVGSGGFLKMLPIIFWSYFLKVSYTILLAYPALFLVYCIKKIDKIDVYDNQLPEKSNQKMQLRLVK